MSTVYAFFQRLINSLRVLIATIRYLALNPSPRTLVPKKYISYLGTKVDEQRRHHLRIDNDSRRELIEASRRLIFLQGIGITGARVEERLQAQSMTPTRVSIQNSTSE